MVKSVCLLVVLYSEVMILLFSIVIQFAENPSSWLMYSFVPGMVMLQVASFLGYLLCFTEQVRLLKNSAKLHL